MPASSGTSYQVRTEEVQPAGSAAASNGGLGVRRFGRGSARTQASHETNVLVSRKALGVWQLMMIGSAFLVGTAVALTSVNFYLLVQSPETVPSLVYTLEPFILSSLGVGIALQLLAIRRNPLGHG